MAGIVALAVAVLGRRGASDTLAFLTDTDAGRTASSDTSAIVGPESVDPLFDRILRPAARRLTRRIRDLYPSSHLDRIHLQLLHAGLSTSMRAEEFVTVQCLVAVTGLFVATALAILGSGSLLIRLAGPVLIVAVSLLGPRAWLSRHADARTRSVERDLPDMLDLLTISVEAGLGLEAAMESVCSDLDSPIAQELSRTLQEMGLGLSRHQALDNLKTRTNAEDMRTFILVLSQADVLGMPIGRVLRTQADEMRERRRARAREQAAKLPVKILFPLMAFILPPLMILVLGPAVSGIVGIFSKHSL